jgi:hypothetical protein
MIRRSQRTLSIALALTLLFWAEVVPAAKASSAQMHACRAHVMHPQQLHHMSAGMHACCPQPEAALLPSPIAMAKIACQQDCCKIGGQPAPRVPFLLSSNKAPAMARSVSTDRVASPEAQAQGLIRFYPPPITKAVFDLKTDLRI